jgi:tRNA 2-selenouridine synthase
MPAERIHIDQFLELAKQHPVIDVRSPAEFKHAHIPGAYSIPLFTDEERKVVGTTYKQQSREAAIKIGLEYFGPKMKVVIENVESIVQSYNSRQKVTDSELPTTDYRLLLIYCWRGGMRSAAISWLLDLYGFKVYTLIGGYKNFRNYTLETFKIPFRFNILGGYTGSGKTELLNSLKLQGEKIIDLEAIASHKGSAFGNIGLPPQPTQEMFENLLALELRKSMGNSELSIKNLSDSLFTIHHSPLWLEDESQRIGLVNLPGDLWKNMRNSPVYFLDIPFEERLQHLVEEYGCLDRQRMIDAIERIREKLGGLNAKTAIQLLNEGNTLESFRILLNYYDKHYLKGLHNREGLNSLLQRIECKSVTTENASPLILSSQQQPQKA